MSDELTYPEHEKLKAISEESQVIGNFLDHCGYTLCDLGRSDDFGGPRVDQGRYWPIHKSISDILAEYFDIDLKVIDKEKRQMLEHMRATTKKTGAPVSDEETSVV
jgi:hypothetical protein